MPPRRSGREDSNLRPQRPERCALTGLRYSPMRIGSYTTTTFDATDLVRTMEKHARNT